MTSGINITFGDAMDDANGDFEVEKLAMGRAIALHKSYSERLHAVSGDRELVSPIREELRADEEFWELCAEILEIVDNAQDWMSAIFRVEAKKAHRKFAGRMEEIRLEKIARIAAEKLAEQAEMAEMPTFGMF